MHEKIIVRGEKQLHESEKVLILLHGRGGSARDILTLTSYLNVSDFALLAPQATNSTWYPYSFMVPASDNQPWLDSALQWLREIVQDINGQGFPAENVFLAGFSQGACLMLEFAARNASRFGGIAAFTGGLIGDTIDPMNYKGDFDNTPVLITTGNPDPHVPLERVNESAALLKEMNADVTLTVFEGKPHNVSPDEINLANKIVFKS